jgi:hypothetical protein
MVYGINNELVPGAYKPTNITGGPHNVVAGVNINQQTQRLFSHFAPTCKKHQETILEAINWNWAKRDGHDDMGMGQNMSKPITMNFSGMNIYLPAILRFTRYQGFDP